MDVESPAYEESWANEMILFHNPRALHPVDPTLFLGITQARVDDHYYAETGLMRVLWSRILARRDGNPTWAKYRSQEEPSYPPASAGCAGAQQSITNHPRSFRTPSSSLVKASLRIATQSRCDGRVMAT